jgi:gamma-glutamyltranspeptidase/glutathione hydrolase
MRARLLPRRGVAASLLAALALAACRPPTGAGRIPAGWRLTSAHTAVAPQAMISSNAPLASAAGVEMLRRGGNAVDAAVAVGFALTVAWPEAGNIGGGGFMNIRMADGRAAVVDYREVAPGAATRDMYLDANGELTDKSVVGHLAVGVPGSVAGMAEALTRYGTLPLADVLAPAIRLAEEGFVVDSILHQSIASSRDLIARFGGAAVFLPDGEPIQPGMRLRQPDLARTLRAIAQQGPDAFYRGGIADLIVAEMGRGAGIVTKDDLAAYRPVWREPIQSTYRGHTLLTVPPPSSGGVTITQTLNILEQDTVLPPFASAAYAHLVASAYQRAFIDRNAKLGDPAFVRVPLEQLTSKGYAARLRATIGAMRATPTPEVTTAMGEGASTTHYSVVDGAGNAVATTTTLNNSWGSGVFVEGAGFLLNDEMDDFAARPGHPNMFGLVQGEANAIEPGKRMLSAMAPTIVLDTAGRVLLVVGAAGGPTIITSVAQVILNVVDHGMSLADAMRAPRLHHQALPDAIRYEEGGLAAAVEDSLRAMGYTLQPVRSIANVNAVMRVPGGWEGAVEPRRGGHPLGY